MSHDATINYTGGMVELEAMDALLIIVKRLFCFIMLREIFILDDNGVNKCLSSVIES